MMDTIAGGDQWAEFVASIDQGTTSTRCMIFDCDGAEVGRHQLEHEQVLPQAGWVEHNPIEIWERTTSVLMSTLNATNLSSKDIVALGITNQRETTLVWNRRTGRPYYNAIVWQDTRTDRIASALDRDGRGDVIRHKAGFAPGDLFCRRQTAVDSRQRRGCARRGRERRRGFRHHRHLAVVESDRWLPWRGTRHRRHQCQPDHAHGPGGFGLGRPEAVVFRHPADDAPVHRVVIAATALRCHDARRASRRRGADHWNSRGPARSDGRPGLSAARRG